MAAAATTVVPIYVDCTAKGQNEELQQKYSIKGYPTILYLDPTGKQIKESGSREVNGLVKEIGGVAKNFPGRSSFWHNSLKSAKASKKTVALYVAKEGADPLKISQALSKDLGDRKKNLAWTWETGTAKVLKERELESAPAVLLFDVEKEENLKLLGKATIKEGDDVKVLNEAIDEILKSKK